MEHVRKSAHTAAEEGHNAIDKGYEVLEEVSERGQSAWKEAQKLVKTHPGKVVGASLLLGAVIGGALAFCRSRD